MIHDYDTGAEIRSATFAETKRYEEVCADD